MLLNTTIVGDQPTAMYVYLSTNATTANSETITFTQTSGVIVGTAIFEVANTAPSGLNNPSQNIEVDNAGGVVTHADAQSPNQWVCSVTISTNTTTLCESAPGTINGAAARSYVTDVQVNTTTAGTATAIQLKTGTGTNCGTGTANLSAVTYANTAVGLFSMIGLRTPLVAPFQTEVCVNQAGTTAGTSVVEVHGFFAP